MKLKTAIETLATVLAWLMFAYASPRPATNRIMKISPGNGLVFRMGKTSIAAPGVVARALAASH